MLQVKLEKIVSYADVYSTDEWMLRQISLDPSRVIGITTNNYRIYIYIDGRDPVIVQHRCTLDPVEVHDHVMENLNKILSNNV